MQGNYSVQIESFAERHYIKSFEKKYKAHWDVTLRAIIAELERIDILIGKTNIVEVITDKGDIKIYKTEFRVHGTQESRHKSGNRCIIAVHKTMCVIKILLLYCKTDLGSNNETSEWKKLIKENYPEYCNLL